MESPQIMMWRMQITVIPGLGKAESPEPRAASATLAPGFRIVRRTSGMTG
jgi:hypothetical protein